MNKNKLIIIILLLFCIFQTLSCSRKNNKIHMIDKDYNFKEESFIKVYNINSSTKTIEIGIFFDDGISEQNMVLGNLEVEIILEKNNITKKLCRNNVRLVYKDFTKRLVNKVYFETIEFNNVQVINELKVKVLNRFLVSENAKLVITNLNSSLFFDS